LVLVRFASTTIGHSPNAKFDVTSYNTDIVECNDT
jgi:hypothetical protein